MRLDTCEGVNVMCERPFSSQVQQDSTTCECLRSELQLCEEREGANGCNQSTRTTEMDTIRPYAQTQGNSLAKTGKKQ